MTNEEIAALEARLKELKDKARTQPLLELGQRYFERYWRVGPGRPEALIPLQAGIKALDEAYGHLQPGALRAHAGMLLGMLRISRGSVYLDAEAPDDQEKGITALEEGLKYASTRPAFAEMARFMLAQALLRRAVKGFQSPSFLMAAVQGRAPATVRGDIARSAELFREVEARSSIKELTVTCGTMLTMADALQRMIAGIGPGAVGFDLSPMMEAMAQLQQLGRNGLNMRVPGTVFADMPFTGDELAALDPLDRPVVVVSGERPAEQRRLTQRPPVVTPEVQAAAEVEKTRQDLRELLPGNGEVYAALAELLRSEPPSEVVDDLVSLAGSVVYGAAGAATGTDHLFLAVALYLRDLRDRSDSGSEAGEDAEAAVSSLLAAASALVRERPEGVPVMLLLATLLPDGTLDRVGEQLTEIVQAVRVLGADHLIFPAPADALCIDAMTGRLHQASEIGAYAVVATIDEDAPTSDRAEVSVASLTGLMEKRHEWRPAGEKPVFVANPRGDQEGAAADVMLLRRTFYPRSIGLGRLIEDADGAGTSMEIRAVLDASLLHLACEVTPAGTLALAGDDEFDPSSVACDVPNPARGGLAILPPGRFCPAADALLAAGFAGVIGWRRAVPDRVAALLLFLLHGELADHGRPPAAALGAVRSRFRGPDREPWPQLPAGCPQPSEVREEYWSSLALRVR